MKVQCHLFFCSTIAILLNGAPLCPDLPGEGEAHQLTAIRNYIDRTWKELERESTQLYRDNLEGNKESASILFVPEEEAHLAARSENLTFVPLQKNRIETERAGRLYLPYPYIVPGGRFNEMYGWDSFFIQLGLLCSGKSEMAQRMVENLLYELEHYGKVLNANHSFFLSRSHPPFITAMVMLQYQHNNNAVWLKKCLKPLEKYHRFWCSPPHFTESTGLSRYYDPIAKPAPEAVCSEIDSAGKSHYQRIADYIRAEKDKGRYISDSGDFQLSAQHYINDRSQRESGFDPSFLFGPFNLEITQYNPVCLNCLLYKMEKDIAFFYKELKEDKKHDIWEAKANERKVQINRFLWDEEAGLFLNYNHIGQRRSPYLFGTLFYPLWTGLATSQQAGRIVFRLRCLEREWGLMASAHVTGCQWDAPFGWAPLEWIAVQGLKAYGYQEDARRISQKFLSLVLKVFVQKGGIFEKYNVESGTADISELLQYGYNTNEIGFGWTNGVFLDLLKDLDAEEIKNLIRQSGTQSSEVGMEVSLP